MKSVFSFLEKIFAKSDLQLISNKEVISQHGWKLRFVGNMPSNRKLEYIEGGKNLFLPIDRGMGGALGYFWYVPLSSVTSWKSESDEMFFSEDDRKRVSHNIARGLRALKEKYKIV